MDYVFYPCEEGDILLIAWVWTSDGLPGVGLNPSTHELVNLLPTKIKFFTKGGVFITPNNGGKNAQI